MDVRLINPLIAATQEVLSMMADARVAPEAPQVIAHMTLPEETISVIVEMDGGATGAVILQFPKSVAIRLATSFAGTTMPLEDTFDAIGEIGNMIAGSAKRALNTQLIKISIPRIVQRQEDLGTVGELSPWLEVPFVGSVGEFSMYVSISDLKTVAA